ncbi:MAG: hypothetical protein WBG71_00885 [Leeuwenhoekiella sp.]
MKPLILNLPQRASAVLLVALKVSLFLSCTQDLDFDRTQEFQLANDFTFNLVYFQLAANDFDAVGLGTSRPVKSQQAAITELQYDFIQDKLQEAILTFGVTSTLDKEISSEIVFTDDAGNVTYVIELKSDGSIQGDKVFTENETVIAGVELDRFKTSRFIQVNIMLQNSVTPTSGALEFKSKGIFRFVY